MKYAVRTTRIMSTGEVSVHPIFQVKNTARPYRIHYPEPGVAERMIIYDTEKEAKQAHLEEMVAAECSVKSREELLELLGRCVSGFADLGIPLAAACRVTGSSYQSIRGYIGRYVKPNPRAVARFSIGWKMFEATSERAKKVLVDVDGRACGW